MKLSRVIVVIVFLAILAMATHVSIDSDTWWHLRAGKWMVENRQIIKEDIFSYTSAGKPWQYPGLWVQVMMFKLYNWFGPGGLNLWVSLTVVAIFVFVWRTSDGNIIFRVAVLLLAAMASAIYWAARPYLISYLLFAIFFYLLERNQHGSKGSLWLLPVLMIVWVNSHGGFLAGFILWGPYWVDSSIKWAIAKRQGRDQGLEILKKRWISLLWVGVAMLLLSLLNPQGLKLWTLPFTTVSRQAEQMFIAEWQSPDFHKPSLIPFALLLMLSIGVLGRSRKRLTLYEILLMGGFGLLGLISIRNIFFFVIVAPAIITRSGKYVFSDLADDLHIQLKLDFSKPPTKFGRVINVFIVLLVSFVTLLRVVSIIPNSVNREAFENEFPVKAVEFLQTKELYGQMFNSYNYGGYLIWALPQYPVFVDGRADLHEDDIIMTWFRVIRGSEEWEQVFEKWNIQFVLVEPGVPLLSELYNEGWNTIYEDDLAVIAVSPNNLLGKN